MMKFMVTLNLFVNLLVGIFTNGNDSALTVAQKLAETRIESELEEAMEEIALDNIVIEHNVTWLDQDTGLYELVIKFDDHTIGIDGIFDIDKYGECDDMDGFRYFIDSESYMNYNTDVWEENVKFICPELEGIIF